MPAWQETLRYPIVKLEDQQLDALELVLGGLIRENHLFPADRGTAGMEPKLPQNSTVATTSVLLADTDGTPLARATSLAGHDPTWQTLLGGIEPLAGAEHGPFRPLRLTSPLANQQIVLFDGCPTPVDLLEIQESGVGSGNAHYVLVATTESSRAKEFSGSVDQLRAAAYMHAGAIPHVLIVPEFVDVEGVIVNLDPAGILDLRRRREPRDTVRPGLVILLSGLSGSGKSTIARALIESFGESNQRRTILLDGDEIRNFLSKGLGFSREDREINVERIGWVAARISQAGGIAVCAPIAPFEQTRGQVRRLAEAVGGFHLVHVSTPLEVCEQRDRKGLYAKARAGLIKDFTGIGSPYESPAAADVTIDASTMSIEEAVGRILASLRRSSPLE